MDNLQNGAFKDYIRDIGLYGIVHFILPFTGLITLPLITKVMGVDDYGIYALAIATSGILTWVVSLELRSALIRFLPGEKDKKVISTAFISSLSITLLTGAAVFVFMLAFSGILAINIFHDIYARIYLYIIAVQVIFDVSNSNLYIYFRILEQVKRYLKYEVLFIVVRIALMVAAVLLTESLLYLFLALLVNSMATTMVLLVIFFREQGWTKPDLKILKPYLAFCLPLVFPQFMAWIITLSDRYFISYFWGTKEVGIYSAAYGFPLFISGTNDAIWFVILPVVFRLWSAGSYKEVKKYFAGAVKLFALFIIPANFGLILLANPALTILSTAEIGQESWKVVPFVCLGNIAHTIYGYGADIYQLQNKTRYLIYFVTIAAAVNAIGNFLLVPKYGILGAAIATLIAYMVEGAISMGMARRFFTFPVEWTFIGKALLASIVMSIFLWFYHPTQIWEVILSIFLGAAMYFIVLFLIKGFTREEIKLAKNFLPNRKRGVS